MNKLLPGLLASIRNIASRQHPAFPLHEHFKNSLHVDTERHLAAYRQHLINTLTQPTSPTDPVGSLPDHVSHLELTPYRPTDDGLTRLPLNQALLKHPYFAIIGPRRAGKSHFLRYLSLQSAKGAIHGLSHTPVLIPSATLRSVPHLPTAIQFIIRTSIHINLPTATIEELLSHGVFLLLIDNVSSHLSERHISELMGYIQTFCPLTHCVFTDSICKTLDACRIPTFTTASTTSSDTRTLIDAWAPNFQLSPDSFWNAVKDHPTLLSVASNPFIIRETLSACRNTPAGKLTKTIFEDTLKQLLQGTLDNLPAEAGILATLLAQCMIQSKTSYITNSTVDLYCNQWAPTDCNGDELIDAGLPVLQRYGILDRTDDQCVKFTHDIIRDYFVTRSILQLNRRQIANHYQEASGDMYWELPLSMAAQSHPSPEYIVENLMAQPHYHNHFTAGNIVGDGALISMPLKVRVAKSLMQFIKTEHGDAILKASELLTKLGWELLLSTKVVPRASDSSYVTTLISRLYAITSSRFASAAVARFATRYLSHENHVVRIQSCRILGLCLSSDLFPDILSLLEEESHSGVLDEAISIIIRSRDRLHEVPAEIRRELFNSVERIGCESGDEAIRRRAFCASSILWSSFEDELWR